jgi:hypothetical protein
MDQWIPASTSRPPFENKKEAQGRLAMKATESSSTQDPEATLRASLEISLEFPSSLCPRLPASEVPSITIGFQGVQFEGDISIHSK